MATLEVNSQILELADSSKTNILSVIPKLKNKFPQNSFDIHSILLNGEFIDIKSKNPSLLRALTQRDHLKIITRNYESSIESFILDVNSLLNRTLKSISKYIVLQKSGDLTASNHALSTTIDAIDTFIKSINYIYKERVSSIKELEDLPIKELQINLLSIIKGIITAHKKNDILMLTDLLEHELKDNLTQWKIFILPAIKKAL